MTERIFLIELTDDESQTDMSDWFRFEGSGWEWPGLLFCTWVQFPRDGKGVIQLF